MGRTEPSSAIWTWAERTMQCRYIAALIAALLTSCGGGGPSTPTPIPTPDAVKNAALIDINALRFFAGCGPTWYGPAAALAWSATLESAASILVQTRAPPGANEILTHGHPAISETITLDLTPQDCAKLMNPAYTIVGVSSIGPGFDLYWAIELL